MSNKERFDKEMKEHAVLAYGLVSLFTLTAIGIFAMITIN